MQVKHFVRDQKPLQRAYSSAKQQREEKTEVQRDEATPSVPQQEGGRASALQVGVTCVW